MILYNLVIRLYGLLIHIAAIKKQKAAEWVSGRKNWRNNLQQGIKDFKGEKIIWVHCASYGEFEQGRPLIEAIKEKHKEYRILLTFFSPSGYQAFKNWQGADFICYLPLDTKKNANDFLSIVQPHTIVFIKYEFWVNFLFAIKKQNIPAFLVSAVFKPHHPFFKWYGGFFIKSLTVFTRLFIQDEGSAKLLTKIGITNFEIAGDTRFDRVLKIRESDLNNQLIKNFKQQHKIIMAGSTWPGDEALVLEAYKKLNTAAVKLIIAPHEVDEKSINALTHRLTNMGLKYCLYTQGINTDAEVLIINTIGILSRSYVYANCAYIGGGFNGGLHNVLEPAVFGIPVSFYGQKYERYNEAVQLLAIGAAAKVNNAVELAQVFKKHIFEEIFINKANNDIKIYFESNANATGKILQQLKL